LKQLNIQDKDIRVDLESEDSDVSDERKRIENGEVTSEEYPIIIKVKMHKNNKFSLFRIFIRNIPSITKK
jgi:hypothetical protein